MSLDWSLDWTAIDLLVKPSPDYETLVRQLLEVYSYDFVLRTCNHRMKEAQAFAAQLLGCDPRQRYGEWLARLTATFRQLDLLGVATCLDFLRQVDARQKLEAICEMTGLPAAEIIDLLKYLLNWVLPGKIYLRELVDPHDPQALEVVRLLRENGVRFTLDMLEKGSTRPGREALSAASGAPVETILDLANRADLTRLPYVRGSTVRNLFHAGTRSLEALAQADLPTLTEDVLNYGKSIGKNLKTGMELDSAIAIARVLPRVVEE